MNRNKNQKNNKRKTLCIEKLHYNSILSISELSKALRLDRRTIEEIAYGLGGRRFGNRWRFHWGTVVEYFRNADTETGQRKLLDGASRPRWKASSVQDVPRGKEARKILARSKRMGGSGEGTNFDWDQDPHGIRNSYFMGRELPGLCSAAHG